jgi:hypothetical protein
MSSNYLSTARLVTFSTTILFSVIVMSLSADLISLNPADILNFSALALATSLLSMFTVAIMLVVDVLRQGSFFSYIVVEIVWLSILWVLWLSSGSYAAWTDGQLTSLFPGESNCDFGFFANAGATQGCHEIKGIMAFSFLTWILLMTYTIVLVVLAIRSQERGNSAWTTGVRDGVLFYSIRKTTGGAAQVQTALATAPYSLAPPQQPLPQQFPPQQSPQQQAYPAYPSSYPVAQV